MPNHSKFKISPVLLLLMLQMILSQSASEEALAEPQSLSESSNTVKHANSKVINSWWRNEEALNKASLLTGLLLICLFYYGKKIFHKEPVEKKPQRHELLPDLADIRAEPLTEQEVNEQELRVWQNEILAKTDMLKKVDHVSRAAKARISNPELITYHAQLKKAQQDHVNLLKAYLDMALAVKLAIVELITRPTNAAYEKKIAKVAQASACQIDLNHSTKALELAQLAFTEKQAEIAKRNEKENQLKEQSKKELDKWSSEITDKTLLHDKVMKWAEMSEATPSLDAKLAELYVIAKASHKAYATKIEEFLTKAREAKEAIEALVKGLSEVSLDRKNTLVAQADALKASLKPYSDASVQAQQALDKFLAEMRRDEEIKARSEEAKLSSERMVVAHGTKRSAEDTLKEKFNERVSELKDLLGSDLPPLAKLHKMQAVYNEANAIELPASYKNTQLLTIKKGLVELESQIKSAKSKLLALVKHAKANAHNTDFTVDERLNGIAKALNSARQIGSSEQPIKEIVLELQVYKELLLLEQEAAETSPLPDSRSTPPVKKREIRSGSSSSDDSSISFESSKLPWQNYIEVHSEYAIAFHSVRDICQRISVSLNIEAMNSQAPIGMEEAYVERHQAMAINFNLSRLFEQMAPFHPVFRNLRNHLVHRFYEAQTDHDRLFALAATFTDEHVVLSNLHKLISLQDKSWVSEIIATRFYQENCHTVGLYYANELRKPEVGKRIPDAILNETEGCLSILQEFVKNIDASKSATMVADSKGLLADHARMAVNILYHHFSGSYRGSLVEHFKTHGVLNSEITAMFKIQGLRNAEMHGAGAEVEGGMVGVTSSLDGEPLKAYYLTFRPLGKAFSEPTTSASAATLSASSFAFSREEVARVNEEKYRSSAASCLS